LLRKATEAIFADPWKILKEIPVYGTDGLYARHNPEDNDDWLLPYQHHLKRSFSPRKNHYSPEIDHFLYTISLHINWLSWSDPIPTKMHPHQDGLAFNILSLALAY